MLNLHPLFTSLKVFNFLDSTALCNIKSLSLEKSCQLNEAIPLVNP